MSQTALVIGLGASGEACTKFLLKRHWAVVATDTRNEPPALVRLKDCDQFRFLPLEQASSALDDVALVVISPGISPEHSAVTPLVQAARSRGLEVVGEIELFARELTQLKAERGYSPIVIEIGRAHV